MSTNTQNTNAKDEDSALLLQAEVADALRSEIGFKDAIANQFAALIVGKLRERLGAQRIYIPAPSRAERDAAIRREYNGTNAGEVCARFDISRSRMHEICDEQRKAKSAASPVSCLKTGQLPG